jgi:hypothetical protein
MSAHLSLEQVNDLLDARLSPAVEDETRLHLGECSACMTEANRIAAVVAAAREMRVEVVPRQNLWHAIAFHTVAVPRSRSGRNPWIYTVVLTAIVFSALATWLFVSRPWERELRVPPAVAGGITVAQAGRDLGALRQMPNSDAKIRTLRKIVPAAAKDPVQQLWTDFFEIVETIESAADRRTVLLDVVRATPGNAKVTAMIIAAVEPMRSSSNKADVLVALARAGGVSTPVLNELYLDATMTISSPKDRERALDALSRRAPAR